MGEPLMPPGDIVLLLAIIVLIVVCHLRRKD